MIPLQRFLNLLADRQIEYDIQKEIIDVIKEINSLSEETDAKRYSLLME